MGWLRLIRVNVWWTKMPPFLTLVYAFFLRQGASVRPADLKEIIFILSGLLIGASFAGLINDFYDQHDDKLAGKQNSMLHWNRKFQYLFLAVTVFLGFCYCYLLIKDSLTVVFYFSGWFCFYLYSSELFRLKEKGLFGPLTDGLASQFFPSLFIFSYLYNKGFFCDDLVFVISGSLWMMFSMGVRALIIHQYYDYQNDLRAGLVTWVSSASSKSIKFIQTLIVVSELLFFVVFVSHIDFVFIAVPVSVYFFVLLIFRWFWRMSFFWFKPKPEVICRSLLFDLYISILPFFLAVFIAGEFSGGTIILLLHILLFNCPTLLKVLSLMRK